MSSIEERLERDISAVTKGVIVTERDLLDARAAVDERVANNRPRERRRSLALVAAGAVAVAGIGVAAFQLVGSNDESAVPAGPGPTAAEDAYAHFLNGADPTPQLVDGFWREDNGGLSILFSKDGTVQLDSQGAVYSGPGAWGTYEIDGDAMTLTFTGGDTCKGAVQVMRASLMKNGDMRAVPGDATGGDCTPLPTYQMTWEHVLPTSPKFADTGFSEDTGWKPLHRQPLDGDWAAEGGGYVLEMTPNGAYFVLDESAAPIDEGRWSLETNDLVLTSSARSAACDAGDRFVLSNVQTINPGTPAIRGDVTENACNGTWAPKTWFLIPNNGGS